MRSCVFQQPSIVRSDSSAILLGCAQRILCKVGYFINVPNVAKIKSSAMLPDIKELYWMVVPTETRHVFTAFVRLATGVVLADLLRRLEPRFHSKVPV